MKTKTLSLTLAIAVLFGLGGFFLGTVNSTQEADAQEACTVDSSLLERLYNGVFHRPRDKGSDFHLNKPLDVVLDDMENSEEHDVYSALFLSLKSYEEAIRTSGDELSEEDEEKYLDMIDSALSNAVAWAETLPEQSSEDRVVGPENAREKIMRNYERMLEKHPEKADRANFGLLNALKRIGPPGELPLPEDDDDGEEEENEEEENEDGDDSDDDETSTSTDETSTSTDETSTSTDEQ